MSVVSDKLQSLLSRIDGLSLRERVLVLMTVLVLLFLLWHSLLMGPLQVRRQSINTRIQEIEAQIAELDAEAEAVIARQEEDPDKENRQHLARLQQELARLDERLQAMTDGLISPQEMPRVLEELLTRESNLRLVKLENLTAVPLLAEPAPAVAPNVFRHALRLEFEGGYLDTLRYLRNLEALSRRLFWQDLEIEVVHYPKSRVTITVHTLSLREGWIGV